MGSLIINAKGESKKKEIMEKYKQLHPKVSQREGKKTSSLDAPIVVSTIPTETLASVTYIHVKNKYYKLSILFNILQFGLILALFQALRG
jgi:hypothetical protein